MEVVHPFSSSGFVLIKQKPVRNDQRFAFLLKDAPGAGVATDVASAWAPPLKWGSVKGGAMFRVCDRDHPVTAFTQGAAAQISDPIFGDDDAGIRARRRYRAG